MPSDIKLFRGMLGGVEILLDGSQDDNYKTMKVDEIIKKESLKQDLVCIGCQRPHEGVIFVVVCGACKKMDYPKETVLTSCEKCGGEAQLLHKYKSHLKGHEEDII